MQIRGGCWRWPTGWAMSLIALRPGETANLPADCLCHLSVGRFSDDSLSAYRYVSTCGYLTEDHAIATVLLDAQSI